MPSFKIKELAAYPYLPALVHLSIWVGFLVVFVFIALNGLDIQLSLYRALINTLLLALMFYINSGLLVNRFLEKGNYGIYLLFALLLFFAGSELRAQINSYFIIQIQPEFEKNEFLLRLFAYVTSAGVIVVSTLYQVLQNRYISSHRNLEFEKQHQAAQLSFLRAQINPHFLFNTLNNIYSLSVMQSEQAPKMILQLSELLRYVIYEGKEKEVALEREITHIQKLIEIFETRSKAPINIELRVNGSTHGIYIEPMMLIPLVENCFKHCDFDSNSKAFTYIELNILPDKIQFITRNSKDNLLRKDKMGGVGLSNMRARLDLLYPKKYRLETKEKDNLFESFIEMPIRTTKTPVLHEES